MVYCLQADLAFTSVARRNQVFSDIQAQLTAQPIWGEPLAVAATWDTGQPSIAVDVRFSAQPAQQALVNRIEQFAVGQRTPIAASWYALHPCPHDEMPPAPCVVATRRTW